MIVRLLLALVIGVVGAGIVHIATVLAVPPLADAGPYESAASLGPEGRFHALSVDDPFVRAVACTVPIDPPRRAVATAVLPSEIGFWSASVFARDGSVVYSINDRTAIEGLFDLIVASPQTITELRTELDTNAPELVAVPGERAVVVLRTYVADPTLESAAMAFLRSASCGELQMG